MYNFTIPGIPKGQGRPRFARMGKFVKAYDPKDSRDWKHTVAATALAAGVAPMSGPVRVTVTAFLPRPQRLCRKKDFDGSIYATCKPDVDNLYKLVADALIGVAYADDSQVVCGTCFKFYHEKGGVPRTSVTIAEATP